MDHIDQLIKLALDEDIGDDDITSDAIVDSKMKATARIVAKEHLVLAGTDIAGRVFHAVDPDIVWDPKHEDGEHCEAKKILATVEGRAKSLLTAERTALNFLQHLSGIATTTNTFVKTVAHTKVKILDTRKTTPGMRALEKHAVIMGHGVNHRMGLYDRYLIKGNHIAIAGSISEAIRRVKQKLSRSPSPYPLPPGERERSKVPSPLVGEGQGEGETDFKTVDLVEIETHTLDDVKDALECGVDIIMLDNMSVAQVREAVKIVNGKAKLEVSGNITIENISHYATTGVDFISLGAITHSAPAADIHMVMDIK